MLTYIRREIVKRGRQTAIIATAIALAVAAVLLVSSAARGVADAQAKSLEAMNGVGTDITVTQQPSFEEGGEGRPRMEIPADGGVTLTTGPMTQTMDDSVLSTVAGTSGVASSAGVLSLTQMDFSSIDEGAGAGSTAGATTEGTAATTDGPPAGGPGGGGRGGFGMNQLSVLGVDSAATEVGPASGATLASGRMLGASDTKQAVVSSTYAASESLKEGSTVSIGGAQFTVVGVLSEESSQSAADVWIPLAEAQTLSGEAGKVSTVYVKAADAGSVDAVASALGTALPSQTVATASDLAGTVRGALSSASSWINGFGTWLTVGILVLAFTLVALFVVSSIGRRTGELGTLKALGWSNRRVVGNVAAGTLMQALIGGVAGLLLALGAVWGINQAGITIGGTGAAGGPGGGMPTASAPADTGSNSGSGNSAGTGSTDGGGTRPEMPGGGFAGGGAGGGAGGAGGVGMASMQPSTLTLAPDAAAIAGGLGTALLGGVIAAGAGSIAISRLRPAAALRSVD